MPVSKLSPFDGSFNTSKTELLIPLQSKKYLFLELFVFLYLSLD